MIKTSSCFGHFCDDNSGQRWLKASWLHCKGHSRNCPPVWRCGNGNLEFPWGFAGYDIIYIYIYICIYSTRIYIYIYLCVYIPAPKTSHYLSWFCVPGTLTLYRKITVTHTHTKDHKSVMSKYVMIYHLLRHGSICSKYICLGQRCTSQKQIKLIKSSGFFQAMQVSTANNLTWYEKHIQRRTRTQT